MTVWNAVDENVNEFGYFRSMIVANIDMVGS